MELTVHGKHLDVGDALRTHMKGKLEDINEKYFNRAIDATVTIGHEGHAFFKTHISLRVGKDILVQASGQHTDPYGSFDTTAEKIAKQLRRYKKRLRDHHERLDETAVAASIRENVLAYEDEPEETNDNEPQGTEPAIIAEMTRPIQTMTVSEAVMRMDLSGESAMLFKNSKTGGLNMVYRRADGNIGWVDPEVSLAAVAE
ncbi:MAG: ribosome-associated translation inhibitor RaiA [Pseudobdellovibrionaceae bacterium]